MPTAVLKQLLACESSIQCLGRTEIARRTRRTPITSKSHQATGLLAELDPTPSGDASTADWRHAPALEQFQNIIAGARCPR